MRSRMVEICSAFRFAVCVWCMQLNPRSHSALEVGRARKLSVKCFKLLPWLCDCLCFSILNSLTADDMLSTGNFTDFIRSNNSLSPYRLQNYSFIVRSWSVFLLQHLSVQNNLTRTFESSVQIVHQTPEELTLVGSTLNNTKQTESSAAVGLHSDFPSWLNFLSSWYKEIFQCQGQNLSPRDATDIPSVGDT